MDSFRSGKVSSGRSSFSHTCSLLSQYLKENGSFKELNHSLNKNLENKGYTSNTMDLFPVLEKPGQNRSSIKPDMPMIFPSRDEAYKKSNLSDVKPDLKTSQMTIFYAGKVIVFDNFPADKAKEIMNLASKSSGSAHNSTFASPVAAQTPAESIAGVHDILAAFGTDLPIARKKSLARFLEKRIDRINANAPYQANKSKSSAAKPSNASPWLGLAPESS